MNQIYISIVTPSCSRKLSLVLLAGLLCFSGSAHAALINVTVTGTIYAIFNITTAPFAVGDSFTYEVIVNDDPLLDVHPSPNYTQHFYSPNFLASVAGSASLAIGPYVISENHVATTDLSISNDSEFSDKIEIIHSTTGAPLIDEFSPVGFSLKREDFSATALSDAVISPELLVSGGFGEVDAVFLSVTGGGACLDRKCAIGIIETITATLIPLPATWLLLGFALAGLGFKRKKA